MQRAWLSGIAGMLAGLVVLPAWGQGKDPTRARELYEEGARLYNLGQYENALHAFEQAYAASGAKPLLFNIAQAHRLAGPDHCDKALLAYETYLREDPQASNRVEVEQRIQEMRVCGERERERERERASRAIAPPPAPTPPSEAPKAEPPPTVEKTSTPVPSIAPIVVTGAGALLAGTGGIIYWRARVKYDHVKGTCPCPDGQFAGWETATNVSYGLMVIGGATLLGGAAWWFLDRRTVAASSYAVVVEPGAVYLVGAF